MLSESQVDTYLSKLGFEETPAPSKENLDKLVYAHQTTIPFSTVDLHRSANMPDLSNDALFEKIVVTGNGGYCFELNKLFQELLVSLGFDARPILSRAVRGRDSRMPINHRGIIVQLDDGLYSVDVGFGGPMPSGALKLEEGVEQNINGEKYIAEKFDHAWWKIDRITGAERDLYGDEFPTRRQTELEICTAASEDIDFEPLSLFCAQPGTLFRENDIVNLRTKDGYKGYKNGELTIRENGEKSVVAFDSSEEQDEAIREHFGMKI